MSLAEQINQDFLVAFKSKNSDVVAVLRMLKSSLTNKEIEKKLPKSEALSDDDVIAIIKSEIKKRKDSYTSYTEANRNDLAEKEEQEIKILEKYLPEQMSDDQIKDIVLQVVTETGASSPADFGKVMGAVMAQTKNQADGQLVSSLVKAVLAK
ncbi:GatB/YqeY domain-containing protein [Candidatus Falkowbacteria bacterium]|uniref:Aspartyl-tRNA amidotransferase n=1 Tax=Candidatus Buchananbacteria bacterium CG10_big_fil_rev_8_21_14_0_10_33_19 TaxID=1974525 RepID=A0A2H0W2W7_9BACT|nr:GatB/YqeY domain-containing protein [Candidatus Falkowbacteria bacterium]PIS05699.1 MAG: aspartyl-tRNA amidotransferase [Candidatus Buchananbacteria bacterium CG10_big_fil_rev_8_21_14_0_10_33_19]